MDQTMLTKINSDLHTAMDMLNACNRQVVGCPAPTANQVTAMIEELTGNLKLISENPSPQSQQLSFYCMTLIQSLASAQMTSALGHAHAAQHMMPVQQPVA